MKNFTARFISNLLLMCLIVIALFGIIGLYTLLCWAFTAFPSVVGFVLLIILGAFILTIGGH